MADATQSFAEMLRKFGSDLGLPKVDVEKLMETNRKNVEALAKSVDIAAQGAKSATMKQAEMFDATFREALDHARSFRPTGSAQDILDKQSAFARKTFDATLSNARELADLVRKSNADAFRLVGDRVAAAAAEIRASVERGAASDKT